MAMLIHLAVLALCLPPCLLKSILQTPPMLVVQPGEAVKLHCNSTATGDPYMYWYRQPAAGGALAFISNSYGKGLVNELTLSHFKHERSKDKEAEYILESDAIEAADAGVYYCAWSSGASVVYFGEGTIVSVLGEGEEEKDPKVKVFPPNKNELQVHHLISLVCIATGFFPEHVRLTWYVNDVEKKDLYQNVPIKKLDGTYSTSKRLSLTRSEYFNPDSTFKCRAAFIGKEDKAVFDEIKGEQDCGVSKESFAMMINQGKISYIMVLFKSAVYALIVLAIIWRKKVLSGSC